MTTLAPLDQQGPNPLLKKIHRGVRRAEGAGAPARQADQPNGQAQESKGQT
jgi:hypothetical protein